MLSEQRPQLAMDSEILEGLTIDDIDKESLRGFRQLFVSYPDKIIFSNPGTMLVSQEQYYLGGESICSNPSLQTMFSLIGAVEKAGSGADTILQGWHEANFDTPVITERSEPIKMDLTFPISPGLLLIHRPPLPPHPHPQIPILKCRGGSPKSFLFYW